MLQVTEAGEARGERRQAIDVLKALLADPQLALKADGTSGVGREFVKQSLVSLTSLETVNLLDWQDIAKNGANISWCFHLTPILSMWHEVRSFNFDFDLPDCYPFSPACAASQSQASGQHRYH